MTIARLEPEGQISAPKAGMVYSEARQMGDTVPTGSVYFELRVSTKEIPAVRRRLSLAAWATIMECDPDEKRSCWHFPDIETDADRMPEFIRERCLSDLEAPIKDCIPQIRVEKTDPPSQDFYCFDDNTRYCYHTFALLDPRTEAPLELRTKFAGETVTTPLLMVLTFPSDPLHARDGVFRFMADDLRDRAGDGIEEWPNAFRRTQRAVAPKGEVGRVGRVRSSRCNGGHRESCWVEFRGNECLEFDCTDAFAGDYTFSVGLRLDDCKDKIRLLARTKGDGASPLELSVSGEKGVSRVEVLHGQDLVTLDLGKRLLTGHNVYSVRFDRRRGLTIDVNQGGPGLSVTDGTVRKPLGEHPVRLQFGNGSAEGRYSLTELHGYPRWISSTRLQAIQAQLNGRYAGL